MHRAGAIVVGATVSVRYRDDGKCHIATAVALRRPPITPRGVSGFR